MEGMVDYRKLEDFGDVVICKDFGRFERFGRSLV